MKGTWAVLGTAGNRVCAHRSVLGEVKPATLCVNMFFVGKSSISSCILEQLFPQALPLKGSHYTGGVSNVQNRWLEGGGGGEKVGSAVCGRSLGSSSKQLHLGRGTHVWCGVSASGTCPGEAIQSCSCKKVGLVYNWLMGVISFYLSLSYWLLLWVAICSFLARELFCFYFVYSYGISV